MRDFLNVSQITSLGLLALLARPILVIGTTHGENNNIKQNPRFVKCWAVFFIPVWFPWLDMTYSNCYSLLLNAWNTHFCYQKGSI